MKLDQLCMTSIADSEEMPNLDAVTLAFLLSQTQLHLKQITDKIYAEIPYRRRLDGDTGEQKSEYEFSRYFCVVGENPMSSKMAGDGTVPYHKKLKEIDISRLEINEEHIRIPAETAQQQPVTDDGLQESRTYRCFSESRFPQQLYV